MGRTSAPTSEALAVTSGQGFIFQPFAISLVDAEELEFLEAQLAATELLPCRECRQLTLHAHREVVGVRAVATELLMECTHCQAVRHWLDWNSGQLAHHQRN